MPAGRAQPRTARPGLVNRPLSGRREVPVPERPFCLVTGARPDQAGRNCSRCNGGGPRRVTGSVPPGRRVPSPREQACGRLAARSFGRSKATRAVADDRYDVKLAARTQFHDRVAVGQMCHSTWG